MKQQVLNLENKKLDLAYLGVRDYIDTTSIYNAICASVGEGFPFSSVVDMSIRIFSPVRHESKILWQVPRPQDDVAAQFKFKLDQQISCGWVVEETNILRARLAEPVQDPYQFITVSDGVARVREAFSNHWVYILMAMGKKLILSKWPNSVPRVASWHATRVLKTEEITSLHMVAVAKANQIIELQVFVSGEFFGRVFTKLLF